MQKQEFQIQWLVEAIDDWTRAKYNQPVWPEYRFRSGLCAYFEAVFNDYTIDELIREYCLKNELYEYWKHEYGGWAWPSYYAHAARQRATWVEHCEYRINFMKRMLEAFTEMGYYP
jgi:hypothetical protein